MKLSESHKVQFDVAPSGVQERASPWPFLYSVVPGIGLVVNVAPAPPQSAAAPAPKAGKKATAQLERTVVKRRPPAAKKAAKAKAFANPHVTAAVLKDVDEAWHRRK